jgi:signal transduction histidine kinase
VQALAQQAVPHHQELPLPRDAAEPARAPLKAVLIDDMPEVRLLLRVALEDVGIQVVGEAGDGATGVEVTALQMPDVVVLDVSMPVMDGIAALPWIRDTVPDAKIVMLSAFDRNLAGGVEASSAADAYVEKGHVDVLIRTVLTLCGQDVDEVQAAVSEREAAGTDERVAAPPADLSLITAEPSPLTGWGETSSLLTTRSFPLPVEEEAALAQETLRELLYVAGHDLAEPVGLVVGFAERLAGRWAPRDLEPRDREFVAFTTAAANRLRDMVDALTEYLRACTVPLEVEPLQLTEVLDDVLGALARKVRETGAQVTATRVPDRMVANRHVVTTALRVLVDNALTFTPPGVAPLVEISAVRDATRWVVRVTDNGIGIDPRDAERAFRPYKRLADDQDQGSEPGSGMGLAICRQLVRRHGGDIALRGDQHGGCVVEFSLPVSGEDVA